MLKCNGVTTLVAEWKEEWETSELSQNPYNVLVASQGLLELKSLVRVVPHAMYANAVVL